MGGSGGGSSASYSSSGEDIAALRKDVLKDLKDQERVAAINEFLASTLASFNDRDTQLINNRLQDIQEALGELAVDIDRLFFGGSVAKHTYVDGLSDVDALVVVDAPGVGPGELVERFRRALASRLGAGDVESVTGGTLAVTVKYRDGTEIQLLPAVERGGHTSIASTDSSEWKNIRPHKFAEKLTQVNKANGSNVVPTIKLTKAILDKLPENQKLSGYHIEAIAVDAFRSYSGRRDRASMLTHLVRHIQTSILKPTGDITGQTVHIDSHLGGANNQARKNISSLVASIASKLERGSVDDYRRVLND